ncbi:MAG: hypothetical protein N2512_00310 [Armatimonadetes bacterium]|nr:hypothetical protein [Armatimonadota bacterium]
MSRITVQICTTVPNPREEANHPVKLKNAATGQEVALPTDSCGRAIFQNLASGTYDIYVCGVYKGRKLYAGGDATWYVPTSCPSTG